MAKLKSDQIIESDLLEYLNSYSDFSFELSALKMLRGHDIECEHGGHVGSRHNPILKAFYQR